MNILYPAFGLFALTTICVFRLAYLRLAAIRSGEINPRYFKAFKDYDEPEALRINARHVANLFEAPVLFYVIVVIAFISQQAGWLPVALAWGYVMLRAAHSYVHLTTNYVPLRFRFFAASWIVLIVLWLLVFIGIVLV